MGTCSRWTPASILAKNESPVVDLLHEACAVFVALLELANLLELVGEEVLELLGDLSDGQPIAVSCLQSAEDGGLELGLLDDLSDLLGGFHV